MAGLTLQRMTGVGNRTGFFKRVHRLWGEV